MCLRLNCCVIYEGQLLRSFTEIIRVGCDGLWCCGRSLWFFGCRNRRWWNGRWFWGRWDFRRYRRSWDFSRDWRRRDRCWIRLWCRDQWRDRCSGRRWRRGRDWSSRYGSRLDRNRRWWHWRRWYRRWRDWRRRYRGGWNGGSGWQRCNRRSYNGGCDYWRSAGQCGEAVGGVDAAVARMGVHGDADVCIGRVHDVGSVARTAHEGACQRRDGLATADVLADLRPTARCAAHDVTGMSQETAVRHCERPAVSCGGHR